MSFENFNLFEGILWTLFGIISFISVIIFREKYRTILFFGGLIFIFFGISDFLEITFGNFLETELQWLLWWKVLCILGIITTIIGYVIIRLSKI